MTISCARLYPHISFYIHYWASCPTLKRRTHLSEPRWPPAPSLVTVGLHYPHCRLAHALAIIAAFESRLNDTLANLILQYFQQHHQNDKTHKAHLCSKNGLILFQLKSRYYDFLCFPWTYDVLELCHTVKTRAALTFLFWAGRVNNRWLLNRKSFDLMSI